MAPDRPADAAAFQAGINRIWGYGAQTKAARHFSVDGRTVRKWVGGERGIPPGVMAEIRAMLDIAPPAGDLTDDERDNACYAAVAPLITDTITRAVAAGWHPAEVSTAILERVVLEIRQGAGTAQAIEILKKAASALKAHRDT